MPRLRLRRHLTRRNVLWIVVAAPFLAAGIAMVFDLRSRLLFLGILAVVGTQQFVHGLYRIALPKSKQVDEERWLSFLPARLSEVADASVRVVVGAFMLFAVASEI